MVTDEELDLAVFIVARVYSRLNVHAQSKSVMKNITSIYLPSYLPSTTLVILKSSCCSFDFFSFVQIDYDQLNASDIQVRDEFH